MNKLKDMNEEQKTHLIEYMKKYCNEVTFENGSFQIDSEITIEKIILYGIGEKYYTTIVTGENRLANSVKRI